MREGESQIGRWLMVPTTRLVALIGFTLLACEDPPRRHDLDAELIGGGSIHTMVANAGPMVILLYDPSACFTCDGVLGRWVNYSRAEQVPLHLVLSREPLEAQRQQLLAYRVNILGVLRREPEVPVADAYLLSEDGQLDVARRAAGVAAQVALLDSLAAAGN